jgi:hypothetical protein
MQSRVVTTDAAGGVATRRRRNVRSLRAWATACGDDALYIRDFVDVGFLSPTRSSAAAAKLEIDGCPRYTSRR